MCEIHSIYNKNRPKKQRIMPIEIIERTLEETHTYLKEIIPSTMGEPLLYPHFRRIIDLAEAYNIKINLTTNGTFPILGVEKWGHLILPVASDVKISINGATKRTDEAIMIGVNYERHIENIRRFIEIRDQIRSSGINNPTVTLQVTFMEMNVNELPDLLKMAIEMGVDRIKGHHLWVTWPQLADQSLRRNRESIMKWNKIVDRLHYIKAKYKSNIILDNIYKLPLNSINSVPENWICPFLGKEAWIAWDGTFNVCCAPDYMRRKFGYFGNVLEQGFMNIWNSEKYERLVKTWGHNPVCKMCNMRRPYEDVVYRLRKNGVEI